MDAPAGWLFAEEDLLRVVDEAGINFASLMKAAPRPLTSTIARRRVHNEFAKLSAVGTSLARGFRVAPVGDADAAVWRVDCFNLGGGIGDDLLSKGLHVVSLAVHFEGAYPMEAPTVRVLSPRLDYARSGAAFTAGGLVLLSESEASGGDGVWRGAAMSDVLARVRQLLVTSARLDMEATQPCYTAEELAASVYRASLLTSGVHATQAHFVHTYALHSSEHAGLEHVQGNKVSLPASVLRELMGNGEQPLPVPVLFELSTSTGARTHVGVWEFSAPEGRVVAPAWVLRTVRAAESAAVRLRLVSLPRGTLVRLQPFTRRFLQVNGNDRARVLAMLESQMPLFAAFTTGDVVEVVHDGEAHRFFVLDCQPEKCAPSVPVARLLLYNRL